MKRKLFTTKGHLRPYRSAARPKAMAPTDLNISTSVMPHVICVVVLPNSSARSSTVKLTVKKSKASHDYARSDLCRVLFIIVSLTHAMKPTRKKSHCFPVNIRRSLIGLGALFIGGFKVDNLVAAYVPTLILGGALDSWTGGA